MDDDDEMEAAILRRLQKEGSFDCYLLSSTAYLTLHRVAKRYGYDMKSVDDVIGRRVQLTRKHWPN